MNAKDENLGDDWLGSAKDIAEWWLKDPKRRRTIYYWASLKRYPFLIRVGARICARKSQILAWINAQETRPRK